MKKALRVILIGVLPVCVILLLAVGLLPGGLELTLTPVRQTEPLLVLPLEPGERFTIRYFHSVENAPIWEVHSADETGTIFIEEERYEKFGAGMGRMPGVGRMVRRGACEVIENMHMPTGDFVLRIGSPGVDHTILWRETETHLSRLAPHEAVLFKAEPVRLFYKVFRRFFPNERTP